MPFIHMCLIFLLVHTTCRRFSFCLFGDVKIIQDSYFFMNSATFEEIAVSNKIVDDKAQWIGEGCEVKLVMFKGNVIEVVPPSPAVYVIVETEPTMKGNTASSHTKPAVLDCGATITIPGFLEQGQKIRVDTEKGIYLERA